MAMSYTPNSELCSSLCPPKCPTLCFQIPKISNLFSSRPPLPPRPLVPPLRGPSGNHPQGKILLLLTLTTTVTLIGAIFMVCLLFKKLREWRNSRRNGRALFYDQEQSSLDDDESPPISDHHVWYIQTVGLQQSVIDSIAVFKYRSDDKLIDGSDCSICLGEFREGESLRLLPKCSHGFHVPCIDMWLKSHKNCPLCRAPVVVSHSTHIQPVTDSAPPIGIAQIETEVVDEENRGNSETPLRRSVSMDLVSREEGSSSNADLVELKNLASISRNVPFSKGEIGNQSLCNVVAAIPIPMERFSSGGRKLQWARHYRSRSSVLPL